MLCDDAAPAGDDTLTPDDAVIVLEELLPAETQSYILGLKLKLPLHIVESICATHSQPRDRLLQVLIAFTQQVEPRPTWRVIVDALRSPTVNLTQLAMKVEAAHFPNPTSTRDTRDIPPDTATSTGTLSRELILIHTLITRLSYHSHEVRSGL